MKKNILFTCAGRRNYLINYFKEALNGKGKVIAADNQHLAPALADADIAIQVPNIYDKDYISVLVNIIKKHDVKAIISLNDLELPILSKNKEVLENYNNCEVIISNDDVINIGFDKWKTYNFIKDLGLKTPKTYIKLEDVLVDLKDGSLNFPLVIKPRWGSGSIGIDFPESIEELKLAYELQKIKIRRSILKTASNEDLEQSILIQEKIIGDEYGFDIVNDLKGNHFNSFLRKKLSMRSGETDKAISVINNAFNKIGKLIGENLKHIGNMDGDAFLIDDDFYILEINPRFGGGYPFSHESGANIAALYVDWLLSPDLPSTASHIDYKEGLTFSKCDRLIKIKNIDSII